MIPMPKITKREPCCDISSSYSWMNRIRLGNVDDVGTKCRIARVIRKFRDFFLFRFLRLFANKDMLRLVDLYDDWYPQIDTSCSDVASTYFSFAVLYSLISDDNKSKIRAACMRRWRTLYFCMFWQDEYNGGNFVPLKWPLKIWNLLLTVYTPNYPRAMLSRTNEWNSQRYRALLHQRRI